MYQELRGRWEHSQDAGSILKIERQLGVGASTGTAADRQRPWVVLKLSAAMTRDEVTHLFPKSAFGSGARFIPRPMQPYGGYSFIGIIELIPVAKFFNYCIYAWSYSLNVSLVTNGDRVPSAICVDHDAYHAHVRWPDHTCDFLGELETCVFPLLLTCLNHATAPEIRPFEDI